MAKIIKFVHVMIILIFLLLVSTNIDGNPFLSFSNLLIYFVNNISSDLVILFYYLSSLQQSAIGVLDLLIVPLQCIVMLVFK